MPQRLPSNKRYFLPIAVLFIAISLLSLASIFILTPRIQLDLANKVKNTLVKDGIPAEITLAGRDVTLKGTVADADVKKKAEEVTKKICGIRFVDNQLLTEKPENIALIKKPSKPESSSSIASSNTSASTTPKNKPASENSTSASAQPRTIGGVQLNNTSATEPKETTTATINTAKANTQITGNTTIDTTTDTTTEPNPSSKDKRSLAVTSKDVVKKEHVTTKQTDAHDKQDTPEVTPGKKKHKTLDYQTLLSAMKDYQRNKNLKGRNFTDTATVADSTETANIETIDVQFETQTDTILPSSHVALDTLGARLQENDTQRIKVIVTAENESLARKRAKAIRKYLSAHKIEAKRISTSVKTGNQSVSIHTTP